MIGRAPSNRGVVAAVLFLLLSLAFSGIPQKLMEPSLSSSDKTWHTNLEPQYFCNGELTLIKDGWRKQSAYLKGLEQRVRWSWKLMLKNTSSTHDMKIDFIYSLKDYSGKTVSSPIEHSLAINRLQTKTFSGTADGSLSSLKLATDRNINLICQAKSEE
ncbi:MAG: hypothetical protein PHC51_12645 [bacterium]|nr:hypothetical protein [bacterium]